MATSKLLLDTRKKNVSKTGIFPVVIFITHNRKTLSVQTGFKCTIAQWDKPNLRLKGTYKNSGRANVLISDQFGNINRLLEDNIRTIARMDVHQVRELVLRAETTDVPVSLEEAVKTYFNYLNNIGVPEHQQRLRSEQYLGGLRSIFGILYKAIPEDTPVHTISQNHVGMVFKYLTEKKKKKNGEGISSVRFNDVMSKLASFFSFLKEKGLVEENHFASVKLRQVQFRPLMLHMDEFYEVLEKIDSAKGIRVVEYDSKDGRRKENKNLYRHWLKDSIQLALLGGGRRREEIALLKWSNITPHASGTLFGGTVNYRNLKVERVRGILFEDEQLHIEVPITEQLAELLDKMGWKALKGSDLYLIAPEIENRKKIMEDMSRGFGHYYQLIKAPREKISFKSIRKTYITYIRALISGDAKSITGHTKDRTIEKHYEDTSLIRDKVSKGLKF